MSEDEFTLEPPTPAPDVSAEKRGAREKRLRDKRRVIMVAKFGPGPAGKLCGDCQHLVFARGGRRAYRKCKLYGISSSEATDWSSRWPSCARFLSVFAPKRVGP
jgi:hypothetical protein